MSPNAKAPLPSEPANAPRRYRGPSIALHWLIAALIVVQLGLGWYMNEVVPDHSPAQERIEALHIEFGLTLFVLVLVRVVARLVWPAPRLPADIAGWERVLAQSVHYLLYALLIVIPLSGWALVTTHHEPMSFWGLQWPSLPGLPTGPGARSLSHLLKAWHIYWLIWAVVIAVGLHLAGAIKHQFDGHPVLWRMIPFLRKP